MLPIKKISQVLQTRWKEDRADIFPERRGLTPGIFKIKISQRKRSNDAKSNESMQRKLLHLELSKQEEKVLRYLYKVAFIHGVFPSMSSLSSIFKLKRQRIYKILLSIYNKGYIGKDDDGFYLALYHKWNSKYKLSLLQSIVEVEIFDKKKKNIPIKTKDIKKVIGLIFIILKKDDSFLEKYYNEYFEPYDPIKYLKQGRKDYDYLNELIKEDYEIE